MARIIFAAFVGCALAAPAFAQNALPTKDAYAVFSDHCLNNWGNHAAALKSIGSAKGFKVVDTSGGQGISNRVLAQAATTSTELSALQYEGQDLCFVGFTPNGDRGQAQSELVAMIAARLGVPASAFTKKGKELRLKTNKGTVKVVVDRVYPVSINLSTK